MENKEYIGKVCPYCKSEFKEGDNIVVCSACDMPHHAECWVENQGCTTFGCQGTIKGVDGSVTSVTSTGFTYEAQPAPAAPTAFCTSCGAVLPAGTAFCTSCGTPVAAPAAPRPAPQPTYNQPTYNQPSYTQPAAPVQPTYSQPGYNPNPGYNGQAGYNPNPGYNGQPGYNPNPGYNGQAGFGNQTGLDPNLVAMIRDKQEYYVPKFQEMKQQNKQISWNWCAFLFGAAWMCYRKMYVIGVAWMLLGSLSGLLGELGGILSIAMWVAAGLLGNWAYMFHLEKVLEKTANTPEQEKHRKIFRGTSWLAAIGVPFAMAVVLTILGLV